MVSYPTSWSLAWRYRAALASPSPMVSGSPVFTESMRINSLHNWTTSSSAALRPERAGTVS